MDDLKELLRLLVVTAALIFLIWTLQIYGLVNLFDR